PSEYATAVEIALGSVLQHIVVANESVAKRCIGFLKESRGGRATFLPLTSVKGTSLDIEELYDEDGFLGLGHEIVEYDPLFGGIVKSLLGRTAFAEDIDCAAVIAKKYGYKFKIVTLDGQVISAGGAFTGGSVKKSDNIIGRKQEIIDLQKRLDDISAEAEPIKVKLDTLSAECAKMKLECEGMSESLIQYSAEEMRLGAEIGGVRELLDAFSEQLASHEATRERSKERIKSERESIESNTAELARLTAELSVKEKSASEKSELLSQIVEKRKSVAEAVSGFNLRKIGKNKDIENLRNQIGYLENSRKESAENRENMQNEIESLEKSNAELEAAVVQKREETEKITLRVEEGKSEISALIQKGEAFDRRISEIHASVREKTGHKEKFSAAHATALERKSGLERKSEEIIEMLWNDYEMTPSEAVVFGESVGVEVTDVKQAKSKLNEIKRKIAALGNVNFSAIEEFEEESAKYNELKGHLDDVRNAKSELEKLIEELTLDIRTRFLESFNDINGHFSRIFEEISGGGKARLELTDTSDVLSCGIEIYAAPPEKVINNLISLSGGEKALVAMTLYFAILLHRPTPFCMLDEVDANFDENNVGKYINYLKRYSDTTQLMIITHRRRAIEGCDVLYGVYMQEKGVSRLLKQEVTD
ncbi:MAG: chromosome segregation protein SMC, partial [Oscillospiraceae bacterium]|nr:chromosome segregation protein SMC [Oscillospiraceae bacterium]